MTGLQTVKVVAALKLWP